MEAKIETVIERLLSGYRRYYNVTRFDGGYNPPPEEFKGICEAEKLTPPVLPGDVCFNALCEYYEKAEQYFLFRHNELWATHQEEFIFLFSVPVHQMVRYSPAFSFVPSGKVNLYRSFLLSVKPQPDRFSVLSPLLYSSTQSQACPFS